MNVGFVVLNISILFISSYVITWFFAVYLMLNPWELFMIFAGLNFFNSLLQTYFFPFRVISKAYKEIAQIQLYGIAIFGLLTGVLNLGILANRFDWPTAIMIGVGSSLVGPIVYATLWKLLKKEQN